MKSDTTIEITTGTLIRFLLLVLGLVFLYFIRDIVMIVLVSIIIASAVEPLVRKLMRYRIPRVLSVLAIYVGGLFCFFATFYLLLPPLLNDVRNFLTGLPLLARTGVMRLQESMDFIPLDIIMPRLMSLTQNADSILRQAVEGFFTTTSTVFSGIFSFVFIVVISFYLAVQEDGIANVLRIVAPREYEEYAIGLWKRSQRKIGRWLQGQLLLGAIVGVIVFIALTILQVHHAFPLAVLSALFEIIPYFGPVMAAIPAIALATIQDPFLGILVTGLYVIVQQMENHLIYPQVVRKTVGVPPLLAIIALLIGGKLAGMMGFIVAIPVAVVLVEYLNDVVDHKKSFG